jgi:hypothetical protein
VCADPGGPGVNGSTIDTWCLGIRLCSFSYSGSQVPKRNASVPVMIERAKHFMV